MRAVRRRLFPLVLCLAGCAPSSPVLEVTVRSDVGQVDALSAAVFDGLGVRARIDRLPKMGAPSLPGTLGLELPSPRSDTLTLMVWATKGGATVGFADVSIPPDAPMKGVEVTLVALGADADADLIPDRLDRCTYVADPNQADTDADGSGDACGCRGNRFSHPRFETQSDVSVWSSLEAATATLVDGDAGKKAMRVCRSTATNQFGATTSMPLPAGAARVQLSASMRGTGKAAPLLRQGGSNCDSWDGCNAGGATEPVPLAATFGWFRTTLQPRVTSALDVELTSFDAAVGTCFEVQAVCVEVLP